MVTAFSTVGVPTSHSLLVSVAFGISLTVLSLPGGILWLIDRKGIAAGPGSQFSRTSRRNGTITS